MSSFQKVYEEYARQVYRFLLSLTANDDLAEELLSETFYQAFIHIDQFEGRCSLYTWLCQIGKNAWLKELRRNKQYRKIEVEDEPLMDHELALDERMIRKEMHQNILLTLQSLADPYRDVFVLHAIGEVKLKEIACIYGKSESWARVTYFRAKQQILKEVSK